MPISSSARIYTMPTLAIYDLFVVKFSNTFAWKCPSSNLLALYNRYVSANHLDVGVGTGYFLDRCVYPSHPRITLLDLNPNTLHVSSKRIQRYQPLTVHADILEPLPANLPQFDSIAMNYLIHCLPGDIKAKEMAFINARAHLNDNGVLFGATLLGDTRKSNALAKRLLSIYNAKGIMSNSQDTMEDLDQVLATHFKRHTLKKQGQVAIFTAHV